MTWKSGRLVKVALRGVSNEAVVLDLAMVTLFATLTAGGFRVRAS